MELLRANIATEVGETMIAKMVDGLDEKESEKILDFTKQMLCYPDFLCEHEASCIVKDFINFDGSQGPRWKDPAALFDAMEKLGITADFPGHYNKWAWYTTMNMVWSDEWGVLKLYINPDSEVKVIAEITEARLLDKDRGFRVRGYFGV